MLALDTSIVLQFALDMATACSSAASGAVVEEGAAPTIPSPSVIIVGAGIAGLAAAKTLLGFGVKNITILEGRKRVGGRVFTEVIGPNAVPVNIGAHFIHAGCSRAGCNLLLDFCRKHQIPLVDATSLEQLFFTGQIPGQVVTAEAVEHADQCSKALDGAFFKLAEPSATLRHALDEAPEVANLTIHERLVLEHMVTAKHAYAATPTEISIAGVRDQLKRHHHHVVNKESCGDVILPFGFNQVIQHLVRGLANCVQFDKNVSSITQSADGCVVTTASGEEYRASAVIVTVPLGVLKASVITFSPPLSPGKQLAVERLGFGVQNRAYLMFPAVFWDPAVHAFHCCSDTRFQFFNMCPYGLGPVLSIIIRPPFSSEMEKESDAYIIGEILGVLARMFPRVLPPTACRITRWLSEPFARGSFSFIPASSSMEDVANLAAPEGLLFFAGEATSDEEMQMARGAFTSGIRSASALCAMLRKRGFLPPVPAPAGDKPPRARSDAASAYVPASKRTRQVAQLQPPVAVETHAVAPAPSSLNPAMPLAAPTHPGAWQTFPGGALPWNQSSLLQAMPAFFPPPAAMAPSPFFPPFAMYGYDPAQFRFPGPISYAHPASQFYLRAPLQLQAQPQSQPHQPQQSQPQQHQPKPQSEPEPEPQSEPEPEPELQSQPPPLQLHSQPPPLQSHSS